MANDNSLLRKPVRHVAHILDFNEISDNLLLVEQVRNYCSHLYYSRHNGFARYKHLFNIEANDFRINL